MATDTSAHVRSGSSTGDGREHDESGRADRPQDVSAPGWREIAIRTKDQVRKDNVALLAAGVAFYALLSLVPALVALVSIYGIFADPAQVERQVGDVLSAAPQEVRELVQDQLSSVSESSGGGLGLAALGGIAVALWSASSGMKHLISAVNAAYDEEESRGFLALRGQALLFTLGAVAFVVVAVGGIAALPALLEDTALGTPARLAVSILRWPVLGVALVAGLSVLYRYAPDRDDPRWSWTAPGTLVATLLWLLGSLAFSFYTSNFGSYGETYGSLGAVVVLMLWLMLSAFAVVIGAEINAESEHQTARDTTDGPPEPMGQRGAYVADTVAR